MENDETVYKEWEDRMESAATTASSLEAEKDSGNINRTQSMATLNESFPQGTDSGSGSRIRVDTARHKLDTASIKYALTESPTIYVSLIEQFWQTTSASTLENGYMEITAIVDGKVKVVSETSIRRHLKLEDSDGISTLPTSEIFEQLALMGYVSNSDNLTFQKGHFSPQWKFLIHTIFHYLSSKKNAWGQFSSNIATVIICLATNRTFNFSKLIFDAMVKNLDSKTKILMYPRFIQIFLNKHKRLLLPHKRLYIAHTLTQKLFSNMKRGSKGYTRVDSSLFQIMLVQGQILQGKGSTIPIESHHIPISAPSISQPPTLPPSMQTTYVAEEAATMPHNSPLLRVHSLGSDKGSMTLNELTVLCTTLSKKVETLESDLKQTKQTYGVAYTKLIMKVKKLEHKVKSSKARRRVRLVVSEDEDELEDPSKQGRKIAQIDENEGITLVQMSAQTQGRHEHDFKESDFEFIAPEEDYTAEPDISTGNVPISTASAEVSTASLKVKTAAESLVYIRISAAKRKDKGKAIMKEAGPVQKKTKLQLDQERLGLEEALRLQEQLDEEERQRIARVHEEASTFNAEEWDNIQAQIEADEDFAHRLQAQERERYFEADKDMGSHTLQQLKKLSFYEVNELFETTMKRVNTFTPMESDDTVPKVVAGSSKIDAEHELNQESSKRQKIGEGSKPAEESKDELSQEHQQKLMIIVPEEGMNVEALQIKYPIIDWEVYAEDSRNYWKIIRVERGHDIFMLVEKDYPLTRALMTLMPSNKLQVDEYSVMADGLLRKIFILANRPRQ
ncbi:hypothetical protein Tco_0742027 [Tanacetum coccineum]